MILQGQKTYAERGQVQGQIRDIEWNPRIEVIVYAALGIKKCSYFYTEENLRQLCDEHSYGLEKFYERTRQLNLEIKKNFFICHAGWPDYDYFKSKYAIAGLCREDNIEGMFLDIPQCCAEMYAIQGDKEDRALLRSYPFNGADTPEALSPPIAQPAQGVWWKQFREHFARYQNPALTYTGMVRVQLEKAISEHALPDNLRLLSSMYTPCTVSCPNFLALADKMHAALASHLSAARYRQIMEDYRSGRRSL